MYIVFVQRIGIRRRFRKSPTGTSYRRYITLNVVVCFFPKILLETIRGIAERFLSFRDQTSGVPSKLGIMPKLAEVRIRSNVSSMKCWKFSILVGKFMSTKPRRVCYSCMQAFEWRKYWSHVLWIFRPFLFVWPLVSIAAEHAYSDSPYLEWFLYILTSF